MLESKPQPWHSQLPPFWRLAIKSKIGPLVKYLIISGWLALPLSHLKWLPELGTTRPLSGVLFAMAFGLIILSEIGQEGWSLAEISGWNFLTRRLVRTPEWRFLKWWAILLALGILSAAITPFYGNLFQALNRLLGYLLIFIFIYCGFYSIKNYGVEAVAYWTSIGYLPVLAYAFLEILAVLNVGWALGFVLFIRSWIVTPFPWANRLALLTTEPSFVGFQMILLATILPWVKNRWLQGTDLLLILLSAIFSISGTYLLILAAYLVSLVLFSLPRRIIIWSTATGGVALAGFASLFAVSTEFQKLTYTVMQTVFWGRSLSQIFGSMSIRFSYIQSLIYAILDSHGLGLGIGQYGMFWKDIYLRHIDYQSFDTTGEVSRALSSSEYMRPWSVIFGIGADLGIAGMILLLAFFIQVFKQCSSPHARAIVIACIVALAGAYPIVTPHVWLALSLVSGYGLYSQMEQAPA